MLQHPNICALRASSSLSVRTELFKFLLSSELSLFDFKISSPSAIDSLIKALINESIAEGEEILKSNNDNSEDNKNLNNSVLTLSEEDALKAQIFGCWSIPLGLPYDENLLVRIKLELKTDGTVSKIEILDHDRMNQPGQSFYKVLVESCLLYTSPSPRDPE